MNSLNKIIQQANTVRYDNVHEVDNYLMKDYHKVRFALSKVIINSYIKKPHDSTLLDLAASTCIHAEEFIKDGFKVIAADYGLVPLKYGKKRSNINCIQFDASSTFPIRNESFEVIFMGELIEHLFDTNLLLSECYRVLKPGGILIITTPNLASLQDRIMFLFGISPRHVNADHDYLNLHIRPFTIKSLQKIVLKNNFSIHSTQAGFFRWRRKNGKRLNSRLIAKLFPGFGANLIIACTKPT